MHKAGAVETPGVVQSNYVSLLAHLTTNELKAQKRTTRTKDLCVRYVRYICHAPTSDIIDIYVPTRARQTNYSLCADPIY